MNISYLTPGMSFECDSWGFNAQGQSFVKKKTPATNWTMYMIHFVRYARGFNFETYKEGYGIKKIKVLPNVEEANDYWDTGWGYVPREKKW